MSTRRLRRYALAGVIPAMKRCGTRAISYPFLQYADFNLRHNFVSEIVATRP